MAKKSKLLLALDAQKGRDYEAEKRKKQLKLADKRKKQRTNNNEGDDGSDRELAQINGHSKSQKTVAGDDFEAFDSHNEDEEDQESEDDIVPQPESVVDASASEAE